MPEPDWAALGNYEHRVQWTLVNLPGDDDDDLRDDSDFPTAPSRVMCVDHDDGEFYVQSTELDSFKIYNIDQDDLNTRPQEVIDY